jgi:exonuclease SbcC
MAKIKEITITDFRAYEGSHKFSFQLKEGLANLMMIYAPNGFGKTSFFDAVEWAYVNRLRRFEHRVSKEEIERRDYSSEDKILLTNRSAAKKGKDGIIKIVIDDDKFIQRSVKSRNSKEKFRFYYRPGKLDGNFTQKELNGLPENNILTQDQIDAFLRFTTPDEKFMALKDFWPQGPEATNLYRTLTHYQKVIEQALEPLKKEIAGIKKKINELVNQETNLTKIKDWITILNSSQLIKISFQPISDNITEEVYLSMRNLNETYKGILSAEIEKLDLRTVKFNELIAGYAAYTELLQAINNKRSNIESLRAIQSDYIRLKSAGDEVNSVILDIRKLTIELSELNFLALNWAQFVTDQAEITELRSQIDADRTKNETLINDIRYYESSLSELINWMGDMKTAQEAEKAINDRIELNVKEIVELNSNLDYANQRLALLDITVAQYDNELNTFLLRRGQLQQLIELENVPDSLFTLEIYELLDDLKKQKENLTFLTGQLDDAKIQQRLKNSFNEGLEQILKWGTNQVSALSLTNCPMCQTQFENVAELLNAISADKLEILKLTELEERINSLSLVELDLLDLIKLIECRIVDYCNAETIINDTLIQEFQLNKAILTDQRNQVNQDIIRWHNTIDQLSELITDKTVLIEALDSKNYQPVKEISDSKLLLLNKRILRLQAVIDWKQTTLRASQNQLLNSRNMIEAYQNKALLISNKELYTNIEGLLKKYEFNASDLTIEKIQSIAGEVSLELQKQEQSLGTGNSLVTSIQNKVAAYIDDLGPAAIGGTLTLHQNELNELIRQKEKYDTEYQLLMTVDHKDPDELNLAAAELKETITRFEQLLDQIVKFGVDLGVIQSTIERTKLQTQLEDRSTYERQLKTAKAKVDSAVAKNSEYIKSGIENYFNKEAINNIYGKIEPHPKLTAIDFKPDITDKVPKLQIMAKSDQEELNPNLFFSTGQINVLSLSIFLAKACELGSQKISTIFMDDPVQNLSDINVLSFIDLLRTLIKEEDKQIVISTHDEKFFNLVRNKLSDQYFPTKFIELESYGKIKELVN